MRKSGKAYVTSIELLPEQRLANAIIMQAVLDYQKALKKLRKHPLSNTALWFKSNCERFFKSKAFGIYSCLDGEALMFRIQDNIGYNERSTKT